MSRSDAPFTAFRLWWRGASNGSRSKAAAIGAATFAFLVWITVPSGGGVLTSFAAGFPASATSQGASPAGAPPSQGSQLAASTSDLTAPSMASPGADGITGDQSVGSSTDVGGTGDAVSGDSGGGTTAPDTGAAPGPTTPSSTCPATFPATSTPADGLAAQLSAVCAQLLGGGSGTVPTGSLPGGGSGAQASGGPSNVPRQWMELDAPVGASGAPTASWSPALAAQMGGKSATVVIALVQGSPASPALAGAVGDLVRRGGLVQLLLVPQPSAPGGAPAFASWVTKVLAALPAIERVTVGTGAAPPGSTAATVASYAAMGLGAARDAPGPPTAGVVWLDGGTANADQAVWSSLESAGVWPKSSFVATSWDAAGACTSPAAFAATLHRFHDAATLPVVSEAVQAPAPAAWVAADYSCLKGSVARGPNASMAMWRLWEGPVPR